MTPAQHPVSDPEIQIMKAKLWMMFYELWVMNYDLRFMNFQLPNLGSTWDMKINEKQSNDETKNNNHYSLIIINDLSLGYVML